MANVHMKHSTDAGFNISYNTMYDNFFPLATDKKNEEVDWDRFSSADSEITGSIAGRSPDFEVAAIRTHNVFTWIRDLFLSTLTSIVTLPQTVVRKILMIQFYPAQSAIMSRFIEIFTRQTADEMRLEVAKASQEGGYCFRHLVFKVHGSLYSALLAGHKSTIDNGKWILQAVGNGMTGEQVIDSFAPAYKRLQCNVLIVNNPAVGASLGSCEPKTIQEAQEAGILFLEHALKARTIGICGLSLGGAAVASALQEHRFLADRKYFVVRQVAFDSISNICAKIVKIATASTWLTTFVKHLVRWCGLEIDGVQASAVLQEKKITEIIVQATTEDFSSDAPTKEGFTSDKLIPKNASLGYRLVKKGITGNKVFVKAPNLYHNDLARILKTGSPAMKAAINHS